MSSPTKIDIVPITPEHVEGYHRAVDAVARERRYLTLLEALSLQQTRDFVLSVIEKNDPMLIALAANEVVGWCDIRRHPFPAHAHRGTLGMGIVSTHRGRGVGQRLLDAALGEAFVRVELNVRVDNARAIKLYERAGFRREGLLRDAVLVDGKYHDALAMAIVERRFSNS